MRQLRKHMRKSRRGYNSNDSWKRKKGIDNKGMNMEGMKVS
jgi:hypothetical protein